MSETWLNRERAIFLAAFIFLAFGAVTAFNWLPSLENLGEHRIASGTDQDQRGLFQLPAAPGKWDRGLRDFFHEWQPRRPPNQATRRPLTPRPVTPPPPVSSTANAVNVDNNVLDDPPETGGPQTPETPEPPPVPLTCCGVIAYPPPATVTFFDEAANRWYTVQPGDEVGDTGILVLEAEYSRVLVRNREGRRFVARGMENFEQWHESE